MVRYKFRHGNEGMISWVEFRKVHKWRSRFGLCNGSACLCAAAVKVQKSNHHHWDQSSNYCHPPHASHSKTWSSPSHPHNQQDHCKCKLSLMTALLLARRHGRSLFLLLNLFQEVYSNMLTTFLSLAACCHECMLLLSTWLKCHAWSALCQPFDTCSAMSPFSSGEWWLLPFLHSHLRLQQPGQQHAALPHPSGRSH